MKEEKEKQDQKENTLIFKLNKRALRAKICYIFFVMKFTILFSSYFLIAYFMACNTFTQTSKAIDSLNLVYFKDACIENLIVFIRENYIRNQSVVLFEDPSKIGSDSLIQ